MRVRTMLIVLSGTLITLFSCKKEKSQEGEAEVEMCSYAPYYNNSSFSYQAVSSSGDTTEYSLLVTGDSIVNGLKYKVLVNDTDGSVLLSRCDDGVYTQTATDLVIQGYSADKVLTTYLKDDVRAGSSWLDTFSVVTPLGNAKLELKYTITQKNFTKPVLADTFANVISVRMDGSANIGGVPLDLGRIATTYYAAGVGLIEIDRDGDTTRIISYNINN